jgi:signal transduction histidine kinase
VVAFLAPLGLVVAVLARDRAMDDGRDQVAVATAVLNVTADPGAVASAIAAARPTTADRISVHGLASPVGTSHANAEQLRAAAASPTTVDVADGVALLVPVSLPVVTAAPTAPGAKAGPPPGPAIVEVFVPDSELSRGVRETGWALGAVAVLLLLFSILASDRLAARVVRSARGLAAAARQLGDGDLDVRVDPRGPRELADAATAFNSMADRLATMRAAERELIADLSHRLRTPLTALRLEAERVRGTERFGQAIEAMEAEVDHLIRTARRPAGPQKTEPVVCDAAEVVRERMGFWSAVADDQSRAYRVSGAERSAPVPIPRSDLAAALDALLGNVFRYTPQGTAFEVAVSRRGGHVAIRVDDAGPGISHPLRAQRRGESERGSTGLGLDIVRRAALAGRGTVDIQRGALGGTSVLMLFADAEPPQQAVRPLWGFVGRLSREPGERRWGRRAKAARDQQHSLIRTKP